MKTIVAAVLLAASASATALTTSQKVTLVVESIPQAIAGSECMSLPDIQIIACVMPAHAKSQDDNDLTCYFLADLIRKEGIKIPRWMLAIQSKNKVQSVCAL